jgi:hypothetical protein
LEEISVVSSNVLDFEYNEGDFTNHKKVSSIKVIDNKTSNYLDNLNLENQYIFCLTSLVHEG